MTMKSLTDAIFLRNRILAALENASVEEDEGMRRALLTFVVAGGGFAGVETIGAVNDFVRDALKFYPSLSESLLRIILVHPQEVILPELGEPLGRYAARKLAERKVEIITNTKVSGYTGDAVQLSTGVSIPAETLIWTTGVVPHKILQTLPCEKEKGRIKVDETLAVPGFPGVWALGDCASAIDPDTGRPYPPTAQHALRQGTHTGKNIAATLARVSLTPFKYKMLGQLAAIGHRTGVANILGVNFSGFVAWWMWRTIYLAKLPGFEKKLRVALDWTLDLLFSKDLVQIVTLRGIRQISRRYTRAEASIPVPSQTPKL